MPRTPDVAAPRPVPTVAILLAFALALLASVVVAPAASAAATPSSPPFPPTIDGYAQYERESTCDPTPKPGAVELQRIIRATYGTGIYSNISRSCSASNSGHEEGRAIDWMTDVRDPAEADQAWALINWLLATDEHGNQHAMARRLGVMYIIYDSRSFSLYRAGSGWTEYSDCVSVRTSPADDNSCHRNHVHISLSWAGARAQTSWYTMAGERRPACAVPATQPAGGTAGAAGLGYVPVQPARVLDTRTGDGVGSGPCWLDADRRVDVQVTGTGGVPPSGVAAVVLNVTGTDARRPTWLAAYPAGGAFGGTSSVNLGAGGTAASLVVVGVGGGGKVSLRNGPGAVDVVVDVVGYFPSNGSGAGYVPQTPVRVMDSGVGAGSWSPVRPAVPADAVGVVANVTSDHPARPGYLAAVPGAVTSGVPSTSTVNAVPGMAAANRSFLSLGGGRASLFSQESTRAIVDVTGYLAPGGARFTPVAPTRLVDTRTGQGSVPALRGGRSQAIQVAGRAGVPAGARAVVATLTNDLASIPSHVTAWSGAGAAPQTSDLNILPSGPRANLAVIGLDEAGRASLRLHEGTTHAIVDVLGYYR